MAKSTVPEKVGEVLREIGLTPESSGWDCHGTYVLLHKALEKVAAHKNVIFDPPQILCANVSQKEAVVLVVGRMGERSEWSIGEAASYNNKNSYPFAMAEKRAKDRVILKLVGLHGDVYSEEEADEFKESRPEGMTASAQPTKESPKPVSMLTDIIDGVAAEVKAQKPEPKAEESAPETKEDDLQVVFDGMIEFMKLEKTVNGLRSFYKNNAVNIRRMQAEESNLHARLVEEFTNRSVEISKTGGK